MKTFTSTGSCDPKTNYMVNIDRQVGVAVRMVREGKYFCINRGRQYGKTATIKALKIALEQEDYTVFSLSFQSVDKKAFEGEEVLLCYTLGLMYGDCEDGVVKNISPESVDVLRDVYGKRGQVVYLDDMIRAVRKIARKEKVVLIIDEADEASNHIAFIRFLGVLRDMYLTRNEKATFQSVILAGVYDIKNMKLKVRPKELHQYNSPWNIAASFDTDMSLPADGIAAMLSEYKHDHSLDFDEEAIAGMLRDYTSGYPFLVSRLCLLIDEKRYGWDKEGVLKATNDLLFERNTLFDDMIKKLDENPQLKTTLKSILYSGIRQPYNPDEKYQQIALMFNFITVRNGEIAIACRLMETRLYNYFLAEGN